jgi:hypothetical protein
VSDRGFWIEPAVFQPAECDALIDTLSGLSRSRAGVRHLMSNPVVAAAANDTRMLPIARRGIGKTAVPFRATLFEKTGAKNWLIAWHQDTALPLESKFDAAGWGPWSEKGGVLYAHAPSWALSRVIALRLHLDASTSENGPLRVIPDSHRAGILSDDEVLKQANESESEVCPVGRGGVLAMRPLLIHSSSKAVLGNPRRVLHIEYADSLELSPGVRLAIA